MEVSSCVPSQPVVTAGEPIVSPLLTAAKPEVR